MQTFECPVLPTGCQNKKANCNPPIFNRLANGEIRLLTIYAKGDRSTIPAHELRLIKEIIDDD